MSGNLIEGIYRDRLIDPNGKVIYDSAWKSNMIVMRCRILLAGFIRNEVTARGIQSLKFGSGDAAWDKTPPPAPDPNSLNQLVDVAPLVIAVEKLDLKYLDQNDNTSVTPTNRLQITATLGPGQPAGGPDPYPLREFGLFGQMDFGLTKKAEFMIDYVRHPLIEKDGLVTLERKVRLIF